MHEIRAILALPPAVQMRSAREAFRSHQRETARTPHRKPVYIPTSCRDPWRWIHIQEGASRGHVKWDATVGTEHGVLYVCSVRVQARHDATPDRHVGWTCDGNGTERGFGTPRACGLSVLHCCRLRVVTAWCISLLEATRCRRARGGDSRTRVTLPRLVLCSRLIPSCELSRTSSCLRRSPTKGTHAPFMAPWRDGASKMSSDSFAWS